NYRAGGEEIAPTSLQITESGAPGGRGTLRRAVENSATRGRTRPGDRISYRRAETSALARRNSPPGSAVLPGIEARRSNPVPTPPPGITLRFGWGAEPPSIGY